MSTAVSASACLKTEEKPAAEKERFVTVTPEEAYAYLEGPMDLIVIDVRTPAEYEHGHIAGSINIPIEELDASTSAELKNKKAPILFYCNTGGKSTDAVNLMAEKGYTRLYFLKGGFYDWPYDPETGPSPKTHTYNGPAEEECVTVEKDGYTVYACG